MYPQFPSVLPALHQSCHFLTSITIATMTIRRITTMNPKHHQLQKGNVSPRSGATRAGRRTASSEQQRQAVAPSRVARV